MKETAISDAELGAYVDGELTAQEDARIEAALVVDAALRGRLARLVEARDALGAFSRLGAAGASGAESEDADPETEALAARLGARLRAETARRFRRRAVLAGGALLVTAMGGWFAHVAVSPPPLTAEAPGDQAPAFVADAVGAHAVFAPDHVHPVEFFSQDEALMRDWFAGRLGDDVRIPRLEEVGFDLIGGRLLGSASGPSAQLIYENAAGDRVSLVFGRQGLPGATEAPRLVDLDGRLASWWRQGELSWAVVEDRPGADVMPVTQVVLGLERRSP